MGVFGDRAVADYFGTRIEVEGAMAGLMSAKFKLIIANQAVDEVTVTLGEYSLRGQIIHNGEPKPVSVRIQQGLMGTDMALMVAGQSHPLQRVK